MADCSIATLMQNGRCFCKVTKNPAEIAELQLLCELEGVLSGGISGVTGVNCGDGPPVGPPATGCTLYYDNLTRKLYEWNGAAWVLAITPTEQIVGYVNDPNAELVVPGDQTKDAIAVSAGKTTFTWTKPAGPWA